LVHLGLRELDNAYKQFQAFERDQMEGFGLEIAMGPFLKELTSDPRFAGLFTKLSHVSR